MRKPPVKKKTVTPSRWLSAITETCETCKFLSGKECPFKAEQTIEEIKARVCVFHIRRNK